MTDPTILHALIDSYKVFDRYKDLFGTLMSFDNYKNDILNSYSVFYNQLDFRSSQDVWIGTMMNASGIEEFRYILQSKSVCGGGSRNRPSACLTAFALLIPKGHRWNIQIHHKLYWYCSIGSTNIKLAPLDEKDLTFDREINLGNNYSLLI